MDIRNVKKFREWKNEKDAKMETLQDQIDKEYIGKRSKKAQADYTDRYFFWRGKGKSHYEAQKKAVEEQEELHIH